MINNIGQIFKLAFRNILRNKRRTMLTLFSIMFGASSIVFVGGYIEYTFWGLREATIKNDIGHIQIYQKGFNENSMNDQQNYVLHNRDIQQIEAQLKEMPEISQFSKRINFTGLISSGEKTLTFMGVGIEPGKESKVNTQMTIVSGENLFDSDKNRILIGSDLAKSLGVKVKDNVTLLTTSKSGQINAIDFEVFGLVSRGIKDVDSRSIVILLEDAQRLVDMDGIERYLVFLKNTTDTPKVLSILNKKFAINQYELKSWEELTPYYHQVVRLYNSAFNFLKLVILVIIILSISNTMIMSILERVSEIGTLRAMGTSKLQTVFVIVTEGFLLGTIGGILGIFIGTLIAFTINLFGGIYMPPPPGFSDGYMILVAIVPNVLLFALFLSIFSSLISSIIPAIKASRLRIVDALRHV